MVIHPDLPIADRMWFDEVREMEHKGASKASLSALILARGVAWATEFTDPTTGKKYGGTIIAASKAQAEEVAFGRGLDEAVVGQLVDRWTDGERDGR